MRILTRGMALQAGMKGGANAFRWKRIGLTGTAAPAVWKQGLCRCESWLGRGTDPRPSSGRVLLGGGVDVPLVQEDLPGDEIPQHDDGGREQLRDKVRDAEPIRPRIHEGVVDDESCGGEHEEDDELLAPTQALLVFEDVAHGGHVVEHHRDAERYGGTYQVVDACEFGEGDEQSVVDEEGDEANDSELAELKQ